MDRFDDDLLAMTPEALIAEAQTRRDSIRDHRDQRGDNRCWLDDDKLYMGLPEGYRPNTHMDFDLMYPNCKRFLQTRVHPDSRFAWGEVPGGTMLPVLDQVELELPALLVVPGDWHSLLVDDEHPNVERVWMQYGQGRVYLHVIHPCEREQSLYHPHPWSSAVRILDGWYETAYGHGPPDGEPPPKSKLKVLGMGDRYEMVNPEAWHYVRPIGGTALSVMVTGKPWKSSAHRKGRQLSALSNERKSEIIALCKKFYPLP